jgi:site-specific DNA-methyltransferase (adenine-specific)
VLITQSSQPGELVADPFMGSGSAGVAALRLGRRFLGNDLNPDAVRLAASRLREFGDGRLPEGLTAEPPDLLALMGSQP